MRNLTLSILAILSILAVECKADNHDSDGVNGYKYSLDPGIKAYDRGHYETAMYEFQPRAMQDDPVAQYYVGLMYYLGKGVKKDEKEAIKWFKKIRMIVDKLQKEFPETDGSNKRFMMELYLIRANYFIALYEKKQEIFHQPLENYTEENKEYLQRLAEDGIADAQYRLGLLYANGVTHYTEAVKWYERAASQGHYLAQNNLAMLYKDGNPGVRGKKNLKKAMRLFLEAGQQGLSEAQYNLGNLFKAGIPEISMPSNNEEAYYWFYLAADSKQIKDFQKGSALKSLDELKKKLESDQINEVQSRARRWKKKTRQPGSGSGFHITPEHILTNEHVIRGADEVFVSFLPVKVVAKDTIRDLALLKIDSGENRDAVAKFRSSSVELAEDIGVYGYPLPKTLSYDGNFTKGSVSALVGLGLNELLSEHLQSVRWPDALFQFTAPIQGGNSGGPVFDKAGNVVGVVVMQSQPYYAQNVNFAINFPSIEYFLKEHDLINKVQVDSSTSINTIEWTDIAEQAQKVTVSINTIEWTDIAKQAQKVTVPVLSFKNN